MADAWFVDERVNILRGAAAEAAIRARSDARFFKDGEGIVRIPRERWTIAQTFERTTWTRTELGADDDRNLEHAHRFERYRALLGRRFTHAIELGCGPFTNLRVIAELVEMGKVSLLDPLIESYLTLPKCRYSRTQFPNHSRRRTIPVAEVFPCPIEDMPTEGRQYDLVVMMNVIEHCFDVQTIFDTIMAIMPAGAVFVFHDAIYDIEKTRSVLGDKFYEAGHPLMVGYPVIRKFMTERFNPLYFREFPEPPNQIEVCPHVGLFYFIGTKK